MKKYIYIILGILFLFIAYLIGNWMPMSLFSPVIDKQSISSGEYYRLVVSIISAVITFIAVLVALFKDDFREMWKRPKIKFGEPEKTTIEETSETMSPTGTGTLIEAQKYISRVEVKNEGNIPAINVEIYLEKLEFKEKNSQIAEFIDTISSPLRWNGTAKDSIIIPPGSRKLINVAEIIAPQKLSLPNSAKTNEPAKLSIGNIENINHDSKGIWTATFGLYAQNHAPINFYVVIEWKGVWKTRLTEMDKQYKIVIK